MRRGERMGRKKHELRQPVSNLDLNSDALRRNSVIRHRYLTVLQSSRVLLRPRVYLSRLGACHLNASLILESGESANSSGINERRSIPSAANVCAVRRFCSTLKARLMIAQRLTAWPPTTTAGGCPAQIRR